MPPVADGQRSPAVRMAPRRLAGAHGAAGSRDDKERRRPIVSIHGGDRKGFEGPAGNSRDVENAGTICPHVFHRDGGRIIHFRAAWKNACKAAGCPGALVHDIPRSAVRTFERAGVPRSVAMSIVGHKTESIYRRHAIVDEAMQREAAAHLDAWLAAPPAASSTAAVTPLRRGRRPRRRAMVSKRSVKCARHHSTDEPRASLAPP